MIEKIQAVIEYLEKTYPDGDEERAYTHIYALRELKADLEKVKTFFEKDWETIPNLKEELMKNTSLIMLIVGIKLK